MHERRVMGKLHVSDVRALTFNQAEHVHKGMLTVVFMLLIVIMIGYHCNCLDGQLNCWAFTHWLIGVTIMY